MNFDLVELTASCISHKYLSLNKILTKISFVPNFCLFLILMIFKILLLYGSSLILFNSSNIFRIYRSFELHLHLIKSPILKLNKLGGEVHLAFVANLVSYSSLLTFNKP